MGKNIKEILKFLFPEYQIKECIDERGFIRKSKKNELQGNTQQIFTASQIQTNNIRYRENAVSSEMLRKSEEVAVPKQNVNSQQKTGKVSKLPVSDSGNKKNDINPELLKKLEEKRAAKSNANLEQAGATSKPSLSNSKFCVNHKAMERMNKGEDAKSDEIINISSEDDKVVNKVPAAFDELESELKKYWLGSENDIKSFVKAFKRPYVVGFNNIKPKNSILVIGSESRGKRFAVKCISLILKKKKVFRYSETSEIDITQYVSDSTNILFLSDLYKCQTAHYGRCEPHFDFGRNTSLIVPHRYLTQIISGITADCRSLV